MTALPTPAGDEAIDDPAPVLGEADRLEAAGHILEAIEVVRTANRRSPDLELEKRLVVLRHRAFTEIDRGQGHRSWPPPAPDHFPDAVGPPEVTRDALSAEMVASGIGHHGCLLVRGLASPPRVSALIDVIDQAFAAIDAQVPGKPRRNITPWYVPFKAETGPTIATPEDADTWAENYGPYMRKYVRDGGGVLAADSPRAMFRLVEFFEAVGLTSVITDYLGERPVVAFDKWTLRRTPVDAAAGWHQDGNFLGRGLRTLNVWLALSACGGDTDAPGLDIVPRRFDAVIDSGFNSAVSQEVAEREAGSTPIVRPTFAPGDALLFDDLFLHQTGVSPGMTRERYAIESWFFAPSTYPGNQIPIVF